MSQQPETVETESRRVMCDGANDIRARDGFRPAALGHPRVWLEIDEKGYVECGYCDRRFVLVGHEAHDVTGAAPNARPDAAPGLPA